MFKIQFHNVLANFEGLRNTAFISLSTCLIISVNPAIASGLTKNQLNNITVKSADMTGDGNHELNFKNGSYNNGSGTDKILFTATGDLNGDKIDDGAVVYYEEFGGSGTFVSMAVFLDKNGKAVQIGERVLGDRSKTQSLVIKKGILTLDIITHGPNDPASLPTIRKVVKFQVKQDKLIVPNKIESN